MPPSFRTIPRLGALGAALGAAFTTTTVTLSDPTPQPSDIHDLVVRAKTSLPDHATPSPSTKPAYATTPTTSSDIAHARAVLDRYYALSAKAHASNVQEEQEKKKGVAMVVKNGDGAAVKKGPPRTPPESVFQEFDLDALSGPVCVKYVICGGGTAAWAAIEAILEVDPAAARDILLVTGEEYYPYNRTVLSKELWEGEKREVFRSEEGTRAAVEYGYRGIKGEKVSVVRGKRIEEVDVDDKYVVVEGGRVIHYKKLLLATGGVPRGPGSVSASLGTTVLKEDVRVFRSLQDFRELRQGVEEKGKGVVVVGGGFLGTELAIALTSVSDKVTLVVAEAGVLYNVLPRYLCEFLARRLAEIGVNVVRSAIVTDAFRNPEDEEMVSLNVISPDTDNVEGGRVVVAVGIEPEVGLAKSAGLELDKQLGGIRVNDFMMVEPDVFAAGDVASFHDRSLGRRRVEHWDHAVVSGRIAGRNMAGERARYGFQSMFWSDLANVGVSFTAVGLVDSSLETIAVWNLDGEAIDGAPSANKYLSGVVYYMKDSEVVGTLLWNPKKGSGALRRARALISAKTRLAELSQKTLADLVSLEDSHDRTTVRTKGVASM